MKYRIAPKSAALVNRQHTNYNGICLEVAHLRSGSPTLPEFGPVPRNIPVLPRFRVNSWSEGGIP